MLDTIKADLYRYFPGPYSLPRLVVRGFRAQGFRYMFFWRLVEHHGMSSPIGFIAKFFERRYTHKYGFQIRGKIGRGFYIGHFGTVVISEFAVIGDNCNIAPNVTIGKTNRGSKEGAPTIGNRVWMGTNAVIVGKITIGSNVLIAPNAYVNVDVPDNSIVVGNPATITSRENATEGYINNTV